jgi:hypothetical protein
MQVEDHDWRIQGRRSFNFLPLEAEKSEGRIKDASWLNGLSAGVVLVSFPWSQCPIVDGKYLATCAHKGQKCMLGCPK